jgi:hypothetical protein
MERLNYLFSLSRENGITESLYYHYSESMVLKSVLKYVRKLTDNNIAFFLFLIFRILNFDLFLGSTQDEVWSSLTRLGGISEPQLQPALGGEDEQAFFYSVNEIHEFWSIPFSVIPIKHMHTHDQGCSSSGRALV